MKKDKNQEVITVAEGSSATSVKELIKAEKAELKAKKREERLKKKQKVAYDIRGNVIPDLNKKHVKGIESKKSMYGRMFILPWCIGMVLFFIVPLFESLWYSFCYVEVAPGEMYSVFEGFENYRFIFEEDMDFVNNLTKSISSFFTSMPIIVVVSLILALVLNGNFKGRTFFRGIFFIPVIVATGVVMTLLTRSYGGYGAIVQLSAKSAEDAYSAAGTTSGMDFSTLLNQLNLPEDLTAQLAKMITDIFNTIWTCGIPVVLYIAGLQTIPAQLYEASKVEGATTWEEFWYITLPMIGQTILLVIVFTLIELLTQSNSLVINQAYTQMIENANYYHSAAMLWVFFAIVGAIIGLIILIYSKLCLKRWE